MNEINELETKTLMSVFEALKNFIFTQKLVGGIPCDELRRAYELLNSIMKELERRKINGV